MEENEIGTIIVDSAVKLHQKLGPGLLESVYETILAHKLEGRGLVVERQLIIPIEFDGKKFQKDFGQILSLKEK